MKNLVLLFTILATILSSCSESASVISVTNSIGEERIDEVVIADISNLALVSDQLFLVDQETGLEVRCQVMDSNKDGKPDAVAFQTSLKGNQTKQYIVKEGASKLSATEVKTFARFVPERTDDFTWENEKVAFRTYGPVAQQMVEEGTPGGTLTSGIDCWLKKVDYSIIDKWYAANDKDPGYYHIDHGEGLDNYHVGPSRGCGGTGILIDGALHCSKNFISYEVQENGPVISSFELDYAPYNVGDKVIKERKDISIQMGSYFTKYVIYVEGTDVLTTGITLHDNKGEISKNEVAGWMNYHAPHEGEQLSTSIVAHPDYFVSTSEIISEVADESHTLMSLKVIDGKVEFYAGFTWSGSNQFSDNVAWENYLNHFSTLIQNPIQVQVK